MLDSRTSLQRRHIMSSIHSSNTKPEVKLRHALWYKGFRYRVNDKRLPGSPDIVLPRYKTVIFVHGCFWHGHKGCKNYTVPKTNTDFWVAKVKRNQERDQDVWRKLEAKGWSVIIVWECQLNKVCLEDTLRRVANEICQNGEQLQKYKEDRRESRIAYLQERRARKKKDATFLMSNKITINTPDILP